MDILRELINRSVWVIRHIFIRNRLPQNKQVLHRHIGNHVFRVKARDSDGAEIPFLKINGIISTQDMDAVKHHAIDGSPLFGAGPAVLYDANIDELGVFSRIALAHGGILHNNIAEQDSRNSCIVRIVDAHDRLVEVVQDGYIPEGNVLNGGL